LLTGGLLSSPLSFSPITYSIIPRNSVKPPTLKIKKSKYRAKINEEENFS
ncbi:unnamed protein product, partial [marine sediment metagenome]